MAMWTPQEVKELKELHAKGITFTQMEIGEHNSAECRSKASQIGLFRTSGYKPPYIPGVDPLPEKFRRDQ